MENSGSHSRGASIIRLYNGKNARSRAFPKIKVTEAGSIPEPRYLEIMRRWIPPSRPKDHAIKFIPGVRMPRSGLLPPMSAEGQQFVREQMDTLLDKGLIRSSNSPLGAAVLLVKNKDGKSRMCDEYRGLNEATLKDSTVPPLMSECLSANVEGKV